MKGKSSLMTACVIYIILGLFLVLFPSDVTRLICTVAGILLLTYGGITVLGFLSHRGSSVSFSFYGELILGLISIAGGVVLLTRPGYAVSIFPIVLGLYILIGGLVNLKRGLDMQAFGYAGWTTTLAMAAISLILSVLILWHPFGTGLLLIRVIGLSFLYQGVSDLWTILKLDQLFKNQ